MASKIEILNNLREYTSDQIVEAINAGVVTMYELSKSGNLTPLMRRRIEEKLAAKTTEISQSSHRVVPTKPESAPTLNKNVPVDASDVSDNEDDVVIPEASDIDIHPEMTNPQSAVFISPTPTLESERKESAFTSSQEISNKGMFKRPFSFHGRIRRAEYGISFIIYFIWAMILNAATASNDMPEGLAIFLLVTYIPMIWFILAQSCKRCHDRGNSGWYQLIPFYFFVLLFGDGEEGLNDYGNNPKE